MARSLELQLVAPCLRHPSDPIAFRQDLSAAPSSASRRLSAHAALCRWPRRLCVTEFRSAPELWGEMGRDRERWGEMVDMGRDGERWGEMVKEFRSAPSSPSARCVTELSRKLSCRGSFAEASRSLPAGAVVAFLTATQSAGIDSAAIGYFNRPLAALLGALLGLFSL